MKPLAVFAAGAVLSAVSGVGSAQTPDAAAKGPEMCPAPSVQASFEGPGREPIDYCLFLPSGYTSRENLWRRYPVVYHLSRDGRSDATSLAGLHLGAEPAPILHVVGRLSAARLVSELIPHVDATYRTIDSSLGRALETAAQPASLSGPVLSETFCSVVAVGEAQTAIHEIRCGWRHLPARYDFAPASSIADSG